MANPNTSTATGTTVYYKSQAVTFHGIVTGTDCCAVTDPININSDRIVLVMITDISLTPP